MNSVILTKMYGAPPIDKKEVLRYAGYKIKNGETIDSETQALLDACLKEMQGKLEFKVCYRGLPVAVSGENCDLGLFQVSSRHLARHLDGCTQAIVFAATLGVGIDRLITKYSSLSPAKALMFQAIGAERIEALCDVFCEEIGTTRRFSPGYGDLPLATQKDVFAVLDCEKRIGLTLNDSLLMSPSKSVTAFVGDTL